MLKKQIALFTSFIIIFSMTACSKFESPETSVKNYLDACKSGDFETAAKYTGSETSSLENFKEDLLEKIRENFSYIIISSEEKENTATVNVSVTNIDMDKVFSETMNGIFFMALSGMEDEMLYKQGDSLLESAIEKNIDEKVTNEIKVYLTKGENNWIIDDTSELENAFCGGLINSFNEFTNSLMN